MAVNDSVLDQGRLQDFVGRFAGDLGAALHQTTVIIGDKLGLYAAMGDSAPLTPAELAERTRPTSATFASGSARRPRAATWSTTPRPSAST